MLARADERAPLREKEMSRITVSRRPAHRRMSTHKKGQHIGDLLQVNTHLHVECSLITPAKTGPVNVAAAIVMEMKGLKGKGCGRLTTG
jgi:hypothetical protein